MKRNILVLWILGWFIQLSLTATVEDPCKVTGITINDIDKRTFLVNYTLNLLDPSNCEQGHEWKAYVARCHNYYAIKQEQYIQENGVIDAGSTFHNCSRLRVQDVYSEKIYLRRTVVVHDLAIEDKYLNEIGSTSVTIRYRQDPIIRDVNISIYKVPVSPKAQKEVPQVVCPYSVRSTHQYAKIWDEMFQKNATKMKVHERTTDRFPPTIEYNFEKDVCYYFRMEYNGYCTKLSSPVCYITFDGRCTFHREEPNDTSSPKYDRDVIVIVVCGIVAGIIGIVIASVFVYYRNKRRQPERKPGGMRIDEKKLPQVLLVYADETSLLLKRIFDLRDSLRGFGCEIHDLYEASTLKTIDQNNWLCSMMSVNSPVKILLIFSAKMKSTLKAVLEGMSAEVIQNESDSNVGCQSSLLILALRMALNDYLIRNYSRVFVVRFTDLEKEKEIQLEHNVLVGSRWYSLTDQNSGCPDNNSTCHYQELLKDLGIISSSSSPPSTSIEQDLSCV